MAFTARTIQAIIGAMLAAKAADANLSGLTSTSNAAIWDNLIDAFAIEAHTLETLFADFEESMEARALELPVGTLAWYAAESLEFQYGDSLVLVDGIPVYEVIDDTKQIVITASATESGGFVLIKAAKDDGIGNPSKLAAAELTAFTEYWEQKRFAGTSIQIISQDGDEMIVTARIEVNTQIIGLTGESVATPGNYPVEDAIKAYWAALDFNGRFTIMELVDAMQAVGGVTNVVINDVQAKASGAVGYVNVTSDVDQDYTAVAGYIVEDTVTNLRSSLTYVT